MKAVVGAPVGTSIVGRPLGAGDGTNVSTETPSTLAPVSAVDPALAACDATDDASDPDDTAELSELVTLPRTSTPSPPSSAARLSVGTVTSIDTDAEAAARRALLLLDDDDPSLHTCSLNETPENESTSASAAFSTASSMLP